MSCCPNSGHWTESWRITIFLFVESFGDGFTHTVDCEMRSHHLIVSDIVYEKPFGPWTSTLDERQCAV